MFYCSNSIVLLVFLTFSEISFGYSKKLCNGHGTIVNKSVGQFFVWTANDGLCMAGLVGNYDAAWDYDKVDNQCKIAFSRNSSILENTEPNVNDFFSSLIPFLSNVTYNYYWIGKNEKEQECDYIFVDYSNRNISHGPVPCHNQLLYVCQYREEQIKTTTRKTTRKSTDTSETAPTEAGPSIVDETNSYFVIIAVITVVGLSLFIILCVGVFIYMSNKMSGNDSKSTKSTKSDKKRKSRKSSSSSLQSAKSKSKPSSEASTDRAVRSKSKPLKQNEKKPTVVPDLSMPMLETMELPQTQAVTKRGLTAPLSLPPISKMRTTKGTATIPDLSLPPLSEAESPAAMKNSKNKKGQGNKGKKK